MRETVVYILIGLGSLLMISDLPHMFLDGLVEEEMMKKIQYGVTIFWFFVLAGLGWDIVRRRRKEGNPFQ